MGMFEILTLKLKSFCQSSSVVSFSFNRLVCRRYVYRVARLQKGRLSSAVSHVISVSWERWSVSCWTCRVLKWRGNAARNDSFDSSSYSPQRAAEPRQTTGTARSSIPATRRALTPWDVASCPPPCSIILKAVGALSWPCSN
jgi:hypothetical protein